MKVLVDTCIWSYAFRRQKKKSNQEGNQSNNKNNDLHNAYIKEIAELIKESE